MSVQVLINRTIDRVRQLMDPAASALAEELRHATREELIRRNDIGLDLAAPFPVVPNLEPTPRDGRVQRQLAALQRSFDADICEPPGHNWELIDRKIRGPQGLGWPSVEVGPNARPNIGYTANRQFAWCGAEAAEALGAAGLLPTIRRHVMSSTSRIAKFAVSDDPAKRRIVKDVTQALPGDLCLVGADLSVPGARWYGSHITTFLKFDAARGRVYLHEGNAVAEGPTGTRREGVGRQWRPIKRAKPTQYAPILFVRFLDEDYEPIT